MYIYIWLHIICAYVVSSKPLTIAPASDSFTGCEVYANNDTPLAHVHMYGFGKRKTQQHRHMRHILIIWWYQYMDISIYWYHYIYIWIHRYIDIYIYSYISLYGYMDGCIYGYMNVFECVNMH